MVVAEPLERLAELRFVVVGGEDAVAELALEEDEAERPTARRAKQVRSKVLRKASEALAEKRYESFLLPAEVKKLLQKPGDERSWQKAEALRGIVRDRAELVETLVLETPEDVRGLS